MPSEPDTVTATISGFGVFLALRVAAYNSEQNAVCVIRIDNTRTQITASTPSQSSSTE